MCHRIGIRPWLISVGITLALGCHGPQRIVPHFPYPAAPQSVVNLSETKESTKPSETLATDHASGGASLLELSSVILRAKEYALVPTLLEMEGSIFVGASKCADRDLERILSVLLAHHAKTKRNAVAYEAAVSYVQLRSTERQVMLLADLNDKMDQLIRHTQETEASGGKVPITQDELFTRQALAQVQFKSARQNQTLLQQKLAEQLGITTRPGSLHCATSWSSLLPELDGIEAATQVAILNRGDVQSTDFVLSTLKRNTLPVVRGYLKSADANLGQTPLPSKLSCRSKIRWVVDTAPGEIQLRKEQLQWLLNRQQQSVEFQVASSIERIISERSKLEIVLKMADNTRTSLAKLRPRMGNAGVTEAAVRQEELILIDRELEVLKSDVSAKIAELDLLRAQEAL